MEMYSYSFANYIWCYLLYLWFMADNLKQNYKLQQLFAILALPNIARACLVI